MPDLGEKTYEDIKNNESVQSDENLKQLIKEIDEIKNGIQYDDKIEGVFAETPEGQVLETSLNQGLFDSLSKQDSGTLNIIYGEIKKISEDQNLNLSEDVRQSVKNLLQVFTQFINNYYSLKEDSSNSVMNVDDKNHTGESKDTQALENCNDLTPEQVDNIKIIKDELGINLSSEDIDVIKDIKLTDNQIENIRNIKKQMDDIGVTITVRDIDYIKNMREVKLTQEEVVNIKNLKNYGIDISSSDINKIKDLILTPEQIVNIKNLKNLGINISSSDINEVKDLILTTEQIVNIKNMQNLGIDISSSDINKIKDLILTPEQIVNIKNMQNLGINISSSDINEVKDLILTTEQIVNIKNMQNLGIDISAWNINEVKDLVLTTEQLDNIKNLKNLGIDISAWNINEVKDLVLTTEQLDNIKNLKNLGLYISSSDINEVKDLILTLQQVDNIKNLKNLGLYISSSDINEVKDLILTTEQLDNIKNIQNLGIDISVWNINEVKDLILTPEQIVNIKNIQNLGIKISIGDVNEVKDLILTPEQIVNIKNLKTELGLYISSSDINEVRDLILTPEQLDNIKNIQNLGISISAWNINEVKDLILTPEQIVNIKNLKTELGLYISSSNINEVKDLILTPEQIVNIKNLKTELGISISDWNINDIKDLMLTPEQLDNIKKIKIGLGMDISAGDINVVKDLKLTPERVAYIKNIQNLGIELSIREIEPILNNIDVLAVNSDNFYEGYDYTQEEMQSHYHYKKGRIIENIQSYVQNVIAQNRDIGKGEILPNIRSDLVTLPIEERIKILGGINKVVNKFNTVRKYLDFEKGPYKTPKELLCAMRGITDKKMMDKITDNITVVQHGVGMSFFVGNKQSYQIIYDNSLTDSECRTAGFNVVASEIKDLEGTLSVVNSKDPNEDTSKYEYRTIWHEGQHNRNTYFMGDKEGTPITRAKDEITAYLRDGWRSIERIKEILTKDGGSYQYDLEGKERENHKRQVGELIDYVNDLIELTENVNIGLTRDKVISMLSDTPVDKRQDLHSNIMKAVEKHGNEPILQEFWRAGTAEKQTEIDEIMLANSIEEIKHILNNPKYSHISRIPDNKGGIEVSAIIVDLAEEAKKGSECVNDTDFRRIDQSIREKVCLLILQTLPEDIRNEVKELYIKSFVESEQEKKREEIDALLNK